MAPHETAPKRALAPVVAILADPYDRGYWIIRSDGEIVTKGNLPAYAIKDDENNFVTVGSPIVDATLVPGGDPTKSRMLLVDSDGQVYALGGAPYFGNA